MPVLAVTGLKLEAWLARGPRIISVSGGGDSRALALELERAMAAKPSAIISFGIAGGLAPGLAPGARLVARAIVTENGERFACDEAWAKRLSLRLGGAPLVELVGLDAPVVDPAEKRALFVRTGAVAADMESHLAARTAAAHGLPFAAFRVVTDPAERQLPQAALAGMRPDGGIALGAIARAILRDPSQVAQLVRTARDAAAGFRALSRGRKRLRVLDLDELAFDMPAEDVIRGPLQI